jgi:hypothetical protein
MHQLQHSLVTVAHLLDRESMSRIIIHVFITNSIFVTVANEQVEDLLRETMVMQEALQSNASAGLLEKLLPKRFKQYQRGISSRA